MYRREFLAAGTALAVGTTPGLGSASQAGEFGPGGRLEVEKAKEAVPTADGTTACVAVGDGFVTVDVADPTNPTVLAERRNVLDGEAKRAWDLSVDGDRVLVAGPAVGSGSSAGFAVHDVSDPETPEVLTSRALGHAAHNCFLSEEYAYVTGTGDPDEPLVVYRIGDEEPERVGSWSPTEYPEWAAVSADLRTCHDVVVRDETAYVAFWDAGSWLLDVSDPSNPTPELRLGGRAPSEISADGSNLADIYELPGNSHHVRPNPDGTLVAVGREAFDVPDTDRTGGPGGIALWEVSDPARPRYLTTIAPPRVEIDGETDADTSHNFGFRGNRLYASWYRSGVAVYDLTDPASPTVLEHWADPAHAEFWTARPAAEGFVATSMTDPSIRGASMLNGDGAKVFTFPEPTDADARPARTRTDDGRAAAAQTVTPAPSSATTTAGPTTTATATGSASTDAGATASPTEPTATTRSRSSIAATTTTSRTETPGFGISAALVGATTAVAYRLFASDPGSRDEQ